MAFLFPFLLFSKEAIMFFHQKFFTQREGENYLKASKYGEWVDWAQICSTQSFYTHGKFSTVVR